MYKIVVRSTSIVINDYTLGECEKLERNFLIYNKVTHSYSYKHIHYNNDTRQLTIPRGVDIPFIESLFNVRAYFEQQCDPYIENEEKILIKYPPKDEKQAQALSFLLGQNKYSYTKSVSQLLVALDTGAGKTYLAIAYIAFMNIKSIVIASAVDWLNQWRDRFFEHSNILPNEIYFIKGSNSIESLMKKTPKQLSRYKVYLSTHGTLQSYGTNCGWDKIYNLFVHLGIGIKIFDEAHLNFENINNIDYNTNTYKNIYLTATPGRTEESENKIYKLYFKNVPTLSLFDPDNDPHTHYIALRYYSRMTPLQLSKCMSPRYGFNKMTYCDNVIMTENFDYILRIVMDMILKIPGQKMMFLATNHAVQFIYDWIYSNYPEYWNSVGIYTSINPNKEQAKKYPLILTTSKSAKECLDIANLTCCVQLAEPNKSPYSNKQRFGRTRGYGTYFIDLIDETSAVLRKYYLSNFSMYETYALSVKETKFNDTTLKQVAMNIMKTRMENGISPFLKL